MVGGLLVVLGVVVLLIVCVFVLMVDMLVGFWVCLGFALDWFALMFVFVICYCGFL